MMPRVQLITNRLGARSGEFSMLPQIDDVACHYRGTRRPAGQPCQHENELVLTCRELELERAEALAQLGMMVLCYQTARTSETGGTAMAWMNSAIDAQVSPAHLIVRRIGPADLRDGLAKGLDDFVAMIVAIFFVWLGAAVALDQLTLGRWVPPSSAEFVRQVFTTSSGWTLIIVGCGIGFLFAVVSLTISVVCGPAASGPRRWLRHGGSDVSSSRAREPDDDGDVGPICRRRPRDRILALPLRTSCGFAHTRAFDMASVSQGCGERTC